MDSNNQQPAPMTTPISSMGGPVPAGESKKVGPIIATLVIVVVLIAVALYLFASRMNQNAPADNGSADNSVPAETVQPVTSTSDDVNAIQTDLDASVNGLDNQNF